MVANYDFDVDPNSIEGTLDPGRASNANATAFFLGTTEMVGSRSDGVIKCFRFAAPMILISKIRRNQMVLRLEPKRCDANW